MQSLMSSLMRLLGEQIVGASHGSKGHHCFHRPLSLNDLNPPAVRAADRGPLLLLIHRGQSHEVTQALRCLHDTLKYKHTTHFSFFFFATQVLATPVWMMLTHEFWMVLWICGSKPNKGVSNSLSKNKITFPAIMKRWYSTVIF